MEDLIEGNLSPQKMSTIDQVREAGSLYEEEEEEEEDDDYEYEDYESMEKS